MIILNEKVYAEECLKNKTINGKPYYTLSILAKYYYHCFGYRKKKIIELLTDFIEKSYSQYDCNKAIWDENIEKIAKNAGKYTLHEIDGVWITKSELETIENINNKVLEKLAFTLLCLAKLANIKNPNNTGWVNNDAKEVFNLARISCKASNRFMKFCELHEMGLLEFPKRLDNLSRRVLYINDDSEKVLFISDFRELGYEYLKYKCENFTRCRECGILYRNSKSHPSSYCVGCRAYKRMETKWVTCADCEKEFKVSSKNNQSCRCDECYAEYRRKYKANNERERRQKMNEDN